MNLPLLVRRILQEAESSLFTFLKARRDGAAKIQQEAEKKGGAALVTEHHFAVKRPIYEDAIDRAKEGEVLDDCLASVLNCLKQLKEVETMTMWQFAGLTGQLEAYGEAYIASREAKDNRPLPGDPGFTTQEVYPTLNPNEPDIDDIESQAAGQSPTVAQG
jgi:hypothetical protein